MGKSNIAYHSLRLNLEDEQHRRVEKVLADLNTDIYKSLNQFVIDAIDTYILSLENEGLTKGEDSYKAVEYLTRNDLEEIRKEIKSEVKDDIIRMLGVVLVGGQTVQRQENVPKENSSNAEIMKEPDPIMTGLVGSWG